LVAEKIRLKTQLYQITNAWYDCIGRLLFYAKA